MHSSLTCLLREAEQPVGLLSEAEQAARSIAQQSCAAACVQTLRLQNQRFCTLAQLRLQIFDLQAAVGLQAQQSCAAACAQKLRFCCKPYGFGSKGFVRPANPRCCYATSRVCLANPRGHKVTSQLQIVELQRYACSASLYKTVGFVKQSCARLRVCKHGPSTVP